MADNELSCGPIENQDTFLHLRIASVFIILVTSSAATLFPILAYRNKYFKVPPIAYSFAKYFGSGVIIATGFIHLLGPAIEELGSPCLTGVWQEYPWALGISMMGVFAVFIAELVAFRWGTAKLKALGLGHDTHGHGMVGGSHAAHGPEPDRGDHPRQEESRSTDIEKLAKPEEGHHHHHHHHHHDDISDSEQDAGIAQIIGVAILEFGVVLHSALIGLTLAVDPKFKVLFAVIVFHQMFEGLGLGSRLALMNLPQRLHYVPLVGALLYSFTAPIGIAIGLGVRSTYNPGSTTASIVSGIMDAISSGILLYTGLVELLAHEFLFNPMMHRASTRHIIFACCCVIAGAAVMALLGRWA